MYILKSGKLSRHKGSQFQGYITKGESFEEYASLTKGCLRKDTIKVVEDAELMALGIEDIENALGRSLPLIIIRNKAKHALKTCKIFDKLTDEYVEKVIDCFKIKSVKQGETIIKRDDHCKNGIFFVVEGEFFSDLNKKVLYGDGCFTNVHDTYRCDLRMKENGKIAWTTLEDIIKSFGCSLTEAMGKSASVLKAMENQKINRNNLN